MKHTATRAPRFDREWKEMIALLPEHRQAILEQAIRDYQLSSAEPQCLEGAEAMAFLLIKKIVDRRAKQRIARVRRHATKEASAKADGSDKPSEPEKSMAGTPDGTSENIAHAAETQPRSTISHKRNRHDAIIKQINRLNPKIKGASNRNKPHRGRC
ncbi:MAG: DUF6291 domain-containing protein [Muribaculum sp.]|nr:DUF6291 domain-containing protein [Muribaculum sp.]